MQLKNMNSSPVAARGHMTHSCCSPGSTVVAELSKSRTLLTLPESKMDSQKSAMVLSANERTESINQRLLTHFGEAENRIVQLENRENEEQSIRYKGAGEQISLRT